MQSFPYIFVMQRALSLQFRDAAGYAAEEDSQSKAKRLRAHVVFDPGTAFTRQLIGLSCLNEFSPCSTKWKEKKLFKQLKHAIALAHVRARTHKP